MKSCNFTLLEIEIMQKIKFDWGPLNSTYFQANRSVCILHIFASIPCGGLHFWTQCQPRGPDPWMQELLLPEPGLLQRPRRGPRDAELPGPDLVPGQ